MNQHVKTKDFYGYRKACNILRCACDTRLITACLQDKLQHTLQQTLYEHTHEALAFIYYGLQRLAYSYEIAVCTKNGFEIGKFIF